MWNLTSTLKLTTYLFSFAKQNTRGAKALDPQFKFESECQTHQEKAAIRVLRPL